MTTTTNPVQMLTPEEHESKGASAGRLSVDVELGHVHVTTLSNPDMIRLVFTPEMIKQIATAQLGLQAMGFLFAEVTISLPDDLPLFEEGQLWIQEEKVPGAGDFNPSSTWLQIQTTSLGIEIWDDYGDDELHGQFNIDDVPGLSDAIQAAKHELLGEVIGRLEI